MGKDETKYKYSSDLNTKNSELHGTATAEVLGIVWRVSNENLAGGSVPPVKDALKVILTEEDTQKLWNTAVA